MNARRGDRSVQSVCIKVSKVTEAEEESSLKKKCQEMYRRECGAFVRATAASLQGVAKLIAIPTYFGGQSAIVMEYCGR